MALGGEKNKDRESAADRGALSLLSDFTRAVQRRHDICAPSMRKIITHYYAPQKPGVIAGLVALSIIFVESGTRAATPYEAQIGGFMAAVLQTLITGEFANRSPSQVDAHLDRPVCLPKDYEDLRAAANDPLAFDALRRRCKFTEGKIDPTEVHSIAYLPAGYCERLRSALETVLADEIYAVPRGTKPGLIIEYKGSRLGIGGGSEREIVRHAQLRSTCHSDGSLRVSAPHKPR